MSSEPFSPSLRRDPLCEPELERSDGDPLRLRVRETRIDDLADLLDISRSTYPHDPWREHELAAHLRYFPEGQLVAVDAHDRVLGMAASLRIDASAPLDATWGELTGRGTLSTHRTNGDMLYAAEVMVAPWARGQGVGKALYAARRALAVRTGVRGIRATARLRGYHRVAPRMDARRYADEVRRGRLGDPTLTFQLHQGFRIREVIEDFAGDPETLGFAAVIEWPAGAITPRTRPGTARGRSRVLGAAREVASDWAVTAPR